MFCPFCGNETSVTDSRIDQRGRTRRRRCRSCGEAFVTVERVSPESVFVQKRDRGVERFSRTKLAASIAAALGAHGLGAVDAFVERVVQTLHPSSPGVPIPSTEIGRLVLDRLQDGTPATDIGRIRYAAVFLGRRGTGNSGQQDFLDWLEAEYGPPSVTAPPGTPAYVMKSDGQVEEFQIRKIERGLALAAKGRGSDVQVAALASVVAAEAARELRGQALVTSHQVSAEVLKSLRARDSMAYLRYASVVKRYRSVDHFWLDALGLRDGRQ